MDGVTAIAQILRMEGVDFIGCVPYQPLLEAAAIAGIRPIIFRQEGTGIHMVDGYSRVTNGHRIGVFRGHRQQQPGARPADAGGEAVRAGVDQRPPAQAAQHDPVAA